MASTSSQVTNAESQGLQDTISTATTRRVRIFRHVISTTLQPQYITPKSNMQASAPTTGSKRKRKGTEEAALGRSVREKAATAVVNDFKSGRLRQWQTEGYLESAIVPLEFGTQCNGAHLQAGWVVLTEIEDGAKAVSELVEKRIRPVLKLHTEQNQIKWVIGAPHIHPDFKKLYGYAFKAHKHTHSNRPHSCITHSFADNCVIIS